MRPGVGGASDGECGAPLTRGPRRGRANAARSRGRDRSSDPVEGTAPRSSPVRCRRLTVPCSASRPPTTSIYGILRICASRILYPSFSLRSSSSTRTRAARRRSCTDAGVLAVLLGDRQHPRLHGGQPGRERAGEVLDQDADEPLERAEDRPVDHHRPLGLPVGVDVVELEALRQHGEVDLDGGDLPVAPQRVLDVDVDLRSVERAVARLQLVGQRRSALERVVQRLLGDVPLLAACRDMSGGRVASLNEGVRLKVL